MRRILGNCRGIKGGSAEDEEPTAIAIAASGVAPDVAVSQRDGIGGP
jgi:hypothetical protein